VSPAARGLPIGRGRLQQAGLAGAALFFLTLTVRLIASRGPIELRAPETVLTNSHPAQRHSAPFILFLREVGRRLPEGASVAVIGEGTGTGEDMIDYLLAVGQLPRQSVELWQGASGGSGGGPRFLAVYGREYHEARYRPMATLPSGVLFERVP
jgi:hypothetical protein